jgi:iron complex outermembrane receptor protein
MFNCVSVKNRLLWISVVLLISSSILTSANDEQFTVDPVVVTVPNPSDGIETILKTRDPIQPIPVNDGASLLKVIPGFSVVRKGGIGGDAVYRGLAGSRLNFVLDGMEFLGGCGLRLDPPTAYIFPETYDSARLIKGPQTVKFGNGNSAGVVLFDRTAEKVNGFRVESALTAGSWGRKDMVAIAEYGSDYMSFEGNFSHGESDNYEDGNGDEVHSAYDRDSGSMVFGFEPTDELNVEFDLIVSEAESSSSDRNVDGSLFDRASFGLLLENGDDSAKLSLRAYTTSIDHIMDNFSLRTTTDCGNGTNNRCVLMNVARKTDGLRVGLALGVGESLRINLGADAKQDSHTSRNFMNKSIAVASAFDSAARIKDFESEMVGVFLETDLIVSEDMNFVTGLRSDYWNSSRFQNVGNTNTQSLFLGDDDQHLMSGFVRLGMTDPNRMFNGHVGYGISERPMDYWEATTFNGITAGDVVNIQPERNQQFDVGINLSTENFVSNVSLFFSEIDDYMLTVDAATDSVTNVQVERWGGEIDMRYDVSSYSSLFGSLSYVSAANETDNTPLAQTPPLELQLGLDHSVNKWSFGLLARYVDAQTRIDSGKGTVVGFDRATATPSFYTLAVNAGFEINSQSYVSVGVDNLFDEDYFEHINRTNSPAITGFITDNTIGVKEPGRTVWLKAGIEF